MRDETEEAYYSSRTLQMESRLNVHAAESKSVEMYHIVVSWTSIWLYLTLTVNN
jgi:hypothetical protein